MKYTIAFVCLLCAAAMQAQVPREFTTRDSIKLGAEVEIRARQFKDSLQRSGKYLSEYEKRIAIDYAVDVFRIEEFETGQLEIDNSTIGMVMSAYRALDEYDKLLNRQYKLLMSSLAEEDRPKLKTAQQNWIKFRDAELELALTLTADEYSGGGTIQRVIYAGSVLNLTRERVEDLYQYNLGMFNGE